MLSVIEEAVELIKPTLGEGSISYKEMIEISESVVARRKKYECKTFYN